MQQADLKCLANGRMSATRVVVAHPVALWNLRNVMSTPPSTLQSHIHSLVWWAERWAEPAACSGGPPE